MIKKLGALILAILAIFFAGKHKGKQDAKNKQNKKDIEQVRSSRRIRQAVGKLNASERAKYYSELLNNADR
jgi:hypothetical protein